ncbi:MAG: SRPBCC domain-containing protein [Gammaproteobacteria bacterium]|jgi:carbon monoxide dehydrogenase subunit G
MKFHHTSVIAGDRESLWDFLMDVTNVAACMSDVRNFREIEDDRYEGTLGVRMGPVRLNFEGVVTVAHRDRENWRGELLAEAKDRRAGGGFSAHLRMCLDEESASATRLAIELESTVLGKIGEFGQPIVRRRIEKMLDDFSAAVKARVANDRTGGSAA